MFSSVRLLSFVCLRRLRLEGRPVTQSPCWPPRDRGGGAARACHAIYITDTLDSTIREHAVSGSTVKSAARVLAIVGMGPQLGMAVARRFGREGYRLGLVARNQERLGVYVATLEREG